MAFDGELPTSSCSIATGLVAQGLRVPAATAPEVEAGRAVREVPCLNCNNEKVILPMA